MAHCRRLLGRSSPRRLATRPGNDGETDHVPISGKVRSPLISSFGHVPEDCQTETFFNTGRERATRSVRRTQSCSREPHGAVPLARCSAHSRDRKPGQGVTWLIVGGHDPRVERDRCRRGLQSSGCPDQVADHRLLRRHGNRRSPMAEDPLDGDSLHQVIQAGRSSMGIDVVDVRRVDLRLTKGRRSSRAQRLCPPARGGSVRGRRTRSHSRPPPRRSSGLRRLRACPRLSRIENRRPFPQDEPVPFAIEGTGDLRGGPIRVAHRFH